MLKGSKQTEESKQKISQALKGEKGFWYKRKFSEEHRKNLSLAHKNKKFSKETLEKMRVAGLGRKFSEETKQKLSEQKLGANHPFWKGGRIKDLEGYITIWNHEHPFANNRGYILEHRLIMEKYLNRYLTPEEVVHHINGDPSDNRIENLMLFSNNAEHIKYHKLLKNIDKEKIK